MESTTRSRIADVLPETKFETVEDDVLLWTHNGYGPYARSDIDIMVHCKTQEEGDHIVKQLYHMLLNVDDTPCTVIKTANTVTFARSWPERHVQVVLYVMEHISDMLLFADLDCTAMALERNVPMTTSRSRRALEHKMNLVPVSMLNNRRDTPKRVAAYIKRGFTCNYLQDDHLSDHALLQIRGLQQRVEEALEKKLLDVFVLYDIRGHQFDEEATALYLSCSNTTYSSTNIPCMVGLTSSCIQKFFGCLGGTSAASLMTNIDEIPSTQNKLNKVGLESWVSWLLLGGGGGLFTLFSLILPGST